LRYGQLRTQSSHVERLAVVHVGKAYITVTETLEPQCPPVVQHSSDVVGTIEATRQLSHRTSRDVGLEAVHEIASLILPRWTIDGCVVLALLPLLLLMQDTAG
jgi:hypothetical protein